MNKFGMFFIKFVVLIILITSAIINLPNFSEWLEPPKNSYETQNNIALKIDKAEYEYGEPVNLTVTRSDTPNYIDGCNFNIGKVLEGTINVHMWDMPLQLNCEYQPQYSQEGEDYCDNLRFEINESETKTIVWDQRIYEGENYHGNLLPPPPGSYAIQVTCDLITPTKEHFIHTSVVSNNVIVKIKEPTPCTGKGLEIINSRYEIREDAKVIVTDIKNTGDTAFSFIKLIVSGCDTKRPVHDTSRIFGGIKEGETTTFVMDQNNECIYYYTHIEAQIVECQDMDTAKYSYVAHISKNSDAQKGLRIVLIQEVIALNAHSFDTGNFCLQK